MVRTAVLAAVGLSLICFVGCSFPRAPITGTLFAEVSGNLDVTPGPYPDELKVGEAKATSIIGITTGDCSIDAARKAAGIKTIYSVDYTSRHVLSVWAETVTKVYGE